MPKVITSTELQKQTREAIDYARVERDAVIVETHGRPMAVLLGYEEYQGYLMFKIAQQERERQATVLRETDAAHATDYQFSENETRPPVDEVRDGKARDVSTQADKSGSRYPLRGTPYSLTDPFDPL